MPIIAAMKRPPLTWPASSEIFTGAFLLAVGTTEQADDVHGAFHADDQSVIFHRSDGCKMGRVGRFGGEGVECLRFLADEPGEGAIPCVVVVLLARWRACAGFAPVWDV